MSGTDVVRSVSLPEICAERLVALTEGSMFDRLWRLNDTSFCPFTYQLGLFRTERGKRLLFSAYDEYIRLAGDLPMLMYTPTWRATPERLREAKFTLVDNVFNACAQLREHITTTWPARCIILGGAVGPLGDCYRPTEAPTQTHAFKVHLPLIETLAASGCAFLFCTTLPSATEAIGLANACASTSLPYVLSFVLHSSGHLLDGISLEQAINQIDAEVPRPPLGYFINCTHPQNALAGLKEVDRREPSFLQLGRLIGFQGNTARAEGKELESLQTLDTYAPYDFAVQSLHLRREFGLHIFGGCCGAGTAHIEAVARMLSTIPSL